MKEPITRYVEDRYAKLNEFISMQPDMSELPDFEKEKGKLPEPVWAGHDDEIAAYYKAWEIAFRNLGKPTKESGFVSPYIDAAFNGHIFMWDSCFMLMFGKYGDSGFVEYITETRIAAAKEMLEQGDLKVYEIAEKLGYESAFYFSKVFKKVTGLSPREYQQSI